MPTHRWRICFPIRRLICAPIWDEKTPHLCGVF
jgi:hypothetical protein